MVMQLRHMEAPFFIVAPQLGHGRDSSTPLRSAAKHGVLNCDGDLGPCKGFNEMTEWDVKSVSSTDGDAEQQIDLLYEP